ncbi:hypothetical protein P3T76_000024 [Phytophthora citrophthora]|uniref:Uncharacterized protein n=1 Tax=Phytophthora citrophthora TaxID=4793 RepID=A0AAD9GZV2_9STRA|nr:hypothetical protein P3T76_000024 [Phytophthora citrophthora]
MESLYARDTPTAHDRKLKLSTSHEDEQVTLKAPGNSSQEQPTGSLESFMDTSTTQEAVVVDSTADDTFGFAFSSLPEPQQSLDEQWRSDLTDTKPQQDLQSENPKTEDGRPAEHSGEVAASNSEKTETKTRTMETIQSNSAGSGPPQSRRAGVASMPRKSKPAITINTGSGSTGVGAKRPPPTPVSPPTFSWNDILRVQNLIERCLQQYLSKVQKSIFQFIIWLLNEHLLQNDILVTLKEQANVDPAFTNVVWQKLEEQNPMFFRAYSLQLQLKEQIIAFNYLVRILSRNLTSIFTVLFSCLQVSQQKEMAAKGGKRLLHYSNINRSTASRVSASCSLITTATTTTLPPISMDARTFLRTPIRSAKRTPAGKRAYNTNMYQLGSPSVALGGPTGRTTLPPSPLPLPSPIKTDLDTHAFFT